MSDSEMSPARETSGVHRLVMCEQEGEAAAKKHKHFGDACPYLYFRFPGMTVAQFNEEKRPLMDAWFRGWKKWLDSNGLQYDFKPRQVRT